MFNINLNLTNPFTNRWGIIKSRTKFITDYRALELTAYRTPDIISIELNITMRRDHSGFRFYLGLIGYSIEVYLYDTRHWDSDNNCWEKYET